MSIFKRTKFILILLTIIGAALHFYNLNWGEPYFFHPDERNIASSVSQLNFPSHMNPQFFAYGSLPIYTIYFTGLLINLLTHFLDPKPYTLNPNFEQAILIGRFYSALFATLLISILFVITKRLTHPNPPLSGREQSGSPPDKGELEGVNEVGIFAALLATTSIGFIQFAHFGTFEMWLTFFSILLFWLCLKKLDTKTVLLMGIVFGVLLATKVSSVALLPLPLLTIIMNQFNKIKRQHHQSVIPANAGIQERYGSPIRSGMTIIKKTLLLLIISSTVYILSNPYVFTDTESFLSSMRYESSVALGTLPVFYTGEFINTIPVLFQLQNVYPFLLNPLITILFIPSFFYILYKGFKTKNISLLLLNSFFLTLLISQAFVFVKWTRYMVPTLPFIYLIIAVAINDLLSFRAKPRNLIPQPALKLSGVRSLHPLRSVGMTLACTVNIIFVLSYFITAFVQPDTRVVAQKFAEKNIPSNAPILSEIYDLGIITFNPHFPRIELFNFYDLDSNPLLAADLQTKLTNSDYIILPSQRLLKIRLNNPDQFPNGHSFYRSLINGKLGYKMIYQTPCDIFCEITYLGNPVFRYEETANVFERPTVFIFRKK